MSNIKYLIATALLFTTSLAQADQCAYISEQEANNALSQLKPNSTVAYFCELCGDKDFQEAEDVIVKKLSVQEVDAENKQWEISINGKGIDLAYTYLHTGQSHYINLARLAGCEADSVTAHFEKKVGN